MIAVAGATGQLGRRIVSRLLARGEPVRALVRPASDYAWLEEAGAELAFADLRDPGSLGPALAGARAVITTATASPADDPALIEAVDLHGNRNLIDAARTAGARQFIFISTLLSAPDHPVPLLRAKGLAEQYLQTSGLTYTILRADAFMEIWLPAIVGRFAAAGEPVTLVGEGGRKHSFVSVDDVAALAVATLDHPAAADRAILVGGPEAVSFRDVVAAYARALRRPVAVRTIQPGELIPGLPATVSLLAALLETFDSVVEMAETARTFGIRQTSLADFVRQATA